MSGQKEIIGKNVGDTPVDNALRTRDQIDFDLVELLFFAYRDFISDPDTELEKSGFGRAHHRVVYFVERQPGLTVADLLEILKITKQSLARVLKQLINSGFIRQETGKKDRRQRKLYTTKKGHDLVYSLAQPQSQRIINALNSIGNENREIVAKFLKAMNTH